MINCEILTLRLIKVESNSMDQIDVRGARTHNLKDISLTIPRDKLIVITGLSGSGKSSLAFDTLYAEGQRRYVESLSAYARQFLSLMEKPDVDHIEGFISCNFNRAKINFTQSALNRGYHHRNIRLFTSFIRPCWRTALSNTWFAFNSTNYQSNG